MYENNTEHGLAKCFHENGSLRVKGQFKLGKKEGTFTYFNASGELTKTEDFVGGKSVSVHNEEELFEEFYDYSVSAISEAK